MPAGIPPELLRAAQQKEGRHTERAAQQASSYFAGPSLLQQSIILAPQTTSLPEPLWLPPAKEPQSGSAQALQAEHHEDSTLHCSRGNTYQVCN